MLNPEARNREPCKRSKSQMHKPSQSQPAARRKISPNMSHIAMTRTGTAHAPGLPTKTGSQKPSQRAGYRLRASSLSSELEVNSIESGLPLCFRIFSLPFVDPQKMQSRGEKEVDCGGLDAHISPQKITLRKVSSTTPPDLSHVSKWETPFGCWKRKSQGCLMWGLLKTCTRRTGLNGLG